MFKLTNTLTRTTDEFAPADGATVRMYTCGPTVHNFAHIGNFRTYVFEDVLRRHLRSKWKLVHVMNITDIDDKIIRKSIELGINIKAFTTPFTEEFLEDSAKLRIERPDRITPATDYIPEMIQLVERLLESGHAYREGDSIYYRISSFPGYGRLSHLDTRELKIGARIDADEYEKEQPNVFVLWKAPKDEQVASSLVWREGRLHGAFANPGPVTKSRVGSNAKHASAETASPPIKEQLIGTSQDAQLTAALNLLERPPAPKSAAIGASAS